jgi:P pilus assembly chaperone PapD
MSTKHRICAGVTALATVAMAAAPVGVQGPGELAVAPTRITLDDRERAAELVIANRGRFEATYRVSLVDMRMTFVGRLERFAADQTPEFSAKSLIRFAPKQVTLQPASTQRIRLAVQRPANLAPGEYRSHLLLEALPNSEQPTGSEGSGALSLRFRVVGAVSLPVIVRHGRLSASAQLSEPKVDGGLLQVVLKRSGARSIRGDLSVAFESASDGRRRVVGVLKNLALYAPNTERLVVVKLSKDALAGARGKLTISFEEPSGVEGRARARAVLAIGT